MSDAASLVRRLWELFQAREWDAACDLLADDFACEWPHTRERFHGRDAFIGMNRAYPEGWAIEVLDIHGAGDRATSLVRVTQEDEVFYAASFFELRGGLLAGLLELWVTEGAETPPPWRARFTSS
jgi:hypothetical protein